MYHRYYFIILLLFTSSLSAQTRTVFSGTSGTEDSYMHRGSEGTNFGGADTMQVQNAFATWTTAAIKAININDTIPTGATVIVCSIRVNIKANPSGNKVLYSHRLCKAWLESEVTHERWKVSNNWTRGGALEEGSTDCAACDNSGAGSGDDMIGDSLASISFSGTGWLAIPVDTCHANAWVSGSDVNSGVLITDNGTDNFDVISFYSSEDATNPPEFVFVWEEPSGVPNVRHSAEGTGVRQSGDGASARHGG